MLAMIVATMFYIGTAIQQQYIEPLLGQLLGRPATTDTGTHHNCVKSCIITFIDHERSPGRLRAQLGWSLASSVSPLKAPGMGL